MVYMEDDGVQFTMRGHHRKTLVGRIHTSEEGEGRGGVGGRWQERMTKNHSVNILEKTRPTVYT